MTREPSSVRSVRSPPAYGTPGGPESLLPSSHVEARLRAASNYWITTVGPHGRPHARPVDGVWVDGALCYGGSPETRWAHNLASQVCEVHAQIVRLLGLARPPDLAQQLRWVTTVLDQGREQPVLDRARRTSASPTQTWLSLARWMRVNHGRASDLGQDQDDR